VSLESFADLTYPGGKKPVRTAGAKPAPVPAEPTWDAKPVNKLVKGVEVELFPIGALAKALNRAPVTIRLWERERTIPGATLRLAPKNGVQGRRYYTRSQVEGIRRIAAEEGLLDGRAPITKDFSTKCFALFAELKEAADRGDH